MKRLLIGAGVAAALGLAAGAVLRPELTLRGGSVEMSANPQPVFDDGAALVSYPGPVPDYVVGTDWLARNDSAVGRALAEARPPPESANEPPPIRVERTEFDADAREPAAYPSERGDILAGLHPEAPPSEDDSAPAPPGV